jgi:peptidoglycan DL-endopeptidase LytF
MSRRDTILIAILLNLGLLVILFATARGPEDETPALLQTAAAPTAVVEKSEPIVLLPAKPQAIDEIDLALERYRAAQAEAVAVVKEPVPTPAPERVVVAAPVAPAGDLLEIAVKRGDSLDKIARGNGTTVEKLMRENGLTSTKLQIGQKLRIPAGSSESKSSVKESVKNQAPESTDDYYIVCSGDHPWGIAIKFRIPLDQLLKLNGLDEDSARKLKPGDRVRIR